MTIRPEDGRINLNDLSSPIEYVRTFTSDLLLKLLTSFVEDQEELEDKYSVSQLQDIVLNLSDWVDENTARQNGGSEEDLESSKRPANRSFVSMEEVQKVQGVQPDIYKILQTYGTVYGVKGVNINYTSKEVLMALPLSEILAEDILRRITMGSEEYALFANSEDFCKYLEDRGSFLCKNLEEEYGTVDMLKFNTASHFHIDGAGSSRKITVSAEALAYDFFRAIKDYKASIAVQEALYQQEMEPEASPKKPPVTRTGKGEVPFFIMYWKESL